MAHTLVTIRKRTTFLIIRKRGKMIKGKTFNVQFLQSKEVNNLIYVATNKGLMILSDKNEYEIK